MRQRETGVPSKLPTRDGGPSSRTLARVAKATPISLATFVRLGIWRHWKMLLLFLGLVVQVVLTLLMWQLVDLTVSLMEVWAELARKHLELVLS